MSAGVILVDRQGRALMQLRDDDPKIMFPGHWGLIGGGANADETPEQTARREVKEETGIALGRFEPFRAYYFSESGKKPASARADYELYLFHAPCETPAEEMVCGEGRGLRFFAPAETHELDIAYNHRDVLADFFASTIYARYASGAAFDDAAADADIDPVARFIAELDAGAPWFEALMQAIALWERPQERVGERQYRYLIGGEAFDWLLLAERLAEAAPSHIPDAELERLLFDGVPPGPVTAGSIDDARLRELIGDAKHRAHLNYVYGVTVEEALQYAAELDVAKEAGNVAMHDRREADAPIDPVYERIYGRSRADLIAEFRDEQRLPHSDTASLMELREFMYWLFKYRVQNQEPARVASDTRKALAQLSAMEAAVRRSQRRSQASAETSAEEITV